MTDAQDNEYSAEWITVTAGPNSEGNRVAIYEQDERHPDGQVLVYGDRVEQAYPTEEVVIRLREGFIKEVRGQRQQAQSQQEPQETAAQKKAREKAEAEARENN